MLVKTFGSAVYGVEAITITLEVNWMETGTGYLIVGLPDNAVKESLQRIESTIKDCGYEMKRTRIVVNMAHNGVLFLDELPEFKRTVLEVMRQPMEERRVTISRAKIAVDFPASFMLIASMNPCPCGFYNHPQRECSCPPGAVQKYLNKVSGPLLDRIDLHVEVTPVAFNELSEERSQERSCAVRERVIRAREIQAVRYKEMEGVYCNAQMSSKMLRDICVISGPGQKLLKVSMEKLNLSARAYDRILKVSRTIADLADSDEIKIEHLAEAIQYRSLDREGWGR